MVLLSNIGLLFFMHGHIWSDPETLTVRPPWNRLLMAGVFHSFLMSSFCLPALSPVFNSQKNYRHHASVFSSFLEADFCLTSLSPVFAYITTLLFIPFLSLWSLSDPAHLPCAVSHVKERRNPGSWGFPMGPNTLLWPGFLLDRWLGWHDSGN